MPARPRVRYFPLDGPWRERGDEGLEAPPAGRRYEEVVTHRDGSTEVTIVDPNTVHPVEPGPSWHGSTRPDPFWPGPFWPDAAARRFAETRDFLFCHEARAWFVWDGAIWRRDRTGAVRRAIRRTIGAMASGTDPGGQDAASADARVPARWVAAVEASARADPALAAGDADRDAVPWDAAAFDADPWTLGTPGGTVDLATGALRPADPRDRIARATAVPPAETADCPAWRRFLDETACGDGALTRFLQRFLGYALTGDTGEQALLFCFGEGGNGKSVFANTVRGLLGDYARVAAPDLLARAGSAKMARAPSGELAMLRGARLVTASETEEGQGWAEARVKLLTGGDPVTARFVGRDFFTFRPRFKLMVIGNHMPVLRTVDAALRRRLCVVPFCAEPARPDRTLEARLRAEGPAILRWMIEGCLEWQAHGLGRPACVAEATDAYLGGQDLVGLFLDEACETGGECVATASALYAAWCAHAKAAGEVPGSQRRFAAALERHGLKRERTRHARVYRGARLRRPEEGSASPSL